MHVITDRPVGLVDSVPYKITKNFPISLIALGLEVTSNIGIGDISRECSTIILMAEGRFERDTKIITPIAFDIGVKMIRLIKCRVHKILNIVIIYRNTNKIVPQIGFGICRAEDEIRLGDGLGLG